MCKKKQNVKLKCIVLYNFSFVKNCMLSCNVTYIIFNCNTKKKLSSRDLKSAPHDLFGYHVTFSDLMFSFRRHLVTNTLPTVILKLHLFFRTWPWVSYTRPWVTFTCPWVKFTWPFLNNNYVAHAWELRSYTGIMWCYHGCHKLSVASIFYYRTVQMHRPFLIVSMLKGLKLKKKGKQSMCKMEVEEKCYMHKTCTLKLPVSVFNAVLGPD